MQCPVCNNNDLPLFLRKEKLKYSICNKCKVILQEDFESRENNLNYGKENISNHYDFSFLNRYIGKGKILARFKRAKCIAEFLLQYLKRGGRANGVPSSLNVLDIGGGTGENLYVLKHASTVEFKECILMERSRIDKSIANELYGLDVVADFSEITQKKFHIITMHYVLEHVPRAHEFINTVKAHLNNDGLIFLTLPDPFTWYAKLRGKKWGWFISDHLALYSASACRELFEQHGFQLVAERRNFSDKRYSFGNIIRAILFSALRNHSLPKVLQDGYAHIYKIQELDD